MVNPNRVRWGCRRGMLELDLFLGPFFDAKFDTLSKEEQNAFSELLEEPDPVLQDWLMNNGAVPNARFEHLIKKIRTFKLQQN